MRPAKVPAENFDALFESGSDQIDAHLDWAGAKRQLKALMGQVELSIDVGRSRRRPR